MDDAAVITRLTDLTYPTVMAHGYGADSCVAATYCLIEALKYHGITAKPMAVEYAIFNHEAAEVLDRDGYEAVADLLATTTPRAPGGPWTVGLGLLHTGPLNVVGTGMADNPAAVGHLTAYLPATGLMADATLPQATREHKNIVLPPLVTEVGEEFYTTEGSELSARPDGPDGPMLVTVRRVMQTRWRSSPNWASTEVNRAIIADLIRATRGTP